MLVNISRSTDFRRMRRFSAVSKDLSRSPLPTNTGQDQRWVRVYFGSCHSPLASLGGDPSERIMNNTFTPARNGDRFVFLTRQSAAGNASPKQPNDSGLKLSTKTVKGERGSR